MTIRDVIFLLGLALMATGSLVSGSCWRSARTVFPITCTEAKRCRPFSRDGRAATRLRIPQVQTPYGSLRWRDGRLAGRATPASIPEG